MRITIIAAGRFHSVDLAIQLHRFNHEVDIISSYPKFKLREHGLPVIKVKSFSIIEYYIRIHKMLFGHYPNNFLISNLFDKWASKVLPKNSDIYIIWAGYALNCIHTIRRLNPDAKVILERGSVHIDYQNYLLNQTSKKKSIDPRMIEKEKKEYNQCDYISLPGKFSKRSFLDKGISEEKLFVNNYGVSIQGFTPLAREKNKSSSFKIGYAGVLSAQKNVKGLIKSCAAVHKIHPNIELHLIGAIDSKSFNSALLSEYTFVKYHPPVAQSELAAFYHELDLFVLNSIQDGFGMVLLQAMSCGVPVIATKNTGGLDVVVEGVNGKLVAANDNDQLIDSIIYMIEHPVVLKEMAKNAVDTVKEGFTWDDYGSRYHNFLNSIYE